MYITWDLMPFEEEGALKKKKTKKRPYFQKVRTLYLIENMKC